jgi:hypothetical protein
MSTHEQEQPPKPKRPRRSRAKPAPEKRIQGRSKKGSAPPDPLASVDNATNTPVDGAKAFGSKRRRRIASDKVATALVEPAPSPAQTPLEPVGRPWGVRLGMVRREATAGPLGPRRMLIRDSSGVLMVLALLVLLASQIPTTPASGEENASNAGASSSGGGLLLPGGTLNLFSPTPVQSLAAGKTPRPTFDVTHATLPPWCANLTCTVFVTPSPSPKPTAKPTAKPTPCDPLATACPTPAPTATAVPTAPPGSTTDTTPPSTPVVTATAVSCSRIDLSWSPSTDPDDAVAGYKVYRGNKAIATVTTGTSFSDLNRQESTTYSYKVRAYDTHNNLSAAGTASATTPSC